MITFQQEILNLVKCFRRQWRLFSNSERTTVCGADCMLMALQLSMAEVNKQHHGDFTVSLSDVLETWNYLLHDKLKLSYENMKEPENYADVKKTYHTFLARSNMLDLVDICQKCYSLGLLPEDESIAPVQLLEFISGITNVQENNDSVPSTPSTQVNRQGQEIVKASILAKKSVCSYLSLLVNSKDDLSLAHVLNVPDRGLGREAFTNLKHASQKKKMSIFLQAGDKTPPLKHRLKRRLKFGRAVLHFLSDLTQNLGKLPEGKLLYHVKKSSFLASGSCRNLANLEYFPLGRQGPMNYVFDPREIFNTKTGILMATSFIRTIELGGRDCASSLYDPLRAHVKGLSNFVNFIDKLQEIVGEILNPRIAGGRILSTVKMHLIKGRSNGDPFCQAVEEVVQDLDLKIKNIIDSQQEILTASTTGVSPTRPKLHSINHGTAYCGRDTVKVLLVLLDEESVHPPTQNKADLLYDNESLDLFGITPVLTLFKSPAQSSGSSPKPLRQRIQKSTEGKVIKMKQSSIKSQFACTYKSDLSETSHHRSLEIPPHKHPAPKQLLKAGYGTEGTNSCLDVPVLGTISESLHQTRSCTEMGKLSCQPRNKNSKNEQMDLNLNNDKVICDKESEPSLQKNAKRPKTSNNSQKELDSKIGGKRKQTKTSRKNKLIAGQAKLTEFFRL